MLDDITFEYYKTLYEEEITETAFNRLRGEALRFLIVETTGIDGYKKLKSAFPVDEDDAETVKQCVCRLINTLWQIEMTAAAYASSHGYVQREDGSMVGKVVSSISSGSESISYTAGGSANQTMFEKAVTDIAVKNKLIHDIVENSLRAVTDSNGVNLLYMGRYPYV